MVNDVLTDLIDKVICRIEEDLPVRVALGKGTVPSGRRRELAWATRSRMIRFHLHPDLGARDPNIFNTVFGHVVHVETMRGWFRKEVIYNKWLDMVTNLCKNDIMAVVLEKYRYIFLKGDADRKIGKKALCKYRSIADCATELPHYEQLLLNSTGGMSSQKMTSLAKRNENMMHLKQTTCRLPHLGAAQTRLGAPLKYPAPVAFAKQMIKEQYDRGDPALFQEVMMALKCKFKTSEGKF